MQSGTLGGWRNVQNHERGIEDIMLPKQLPGELVPVGAYGSHQDHIGVVEAGDAGEVAQKGAKVAVVVVLRRENPSVIVKKRERADVVDVAPGNADSYSNIPY